MSPTVQLTNIDLRLLQLFDEIYRTRNLSRAAERMNLTQPAVSLALARLRGHFGDPLFVRAAGNMEPTPHATALYELVLQAISLLQTTIDFRVGFDPQHSTDIFRISMTDVGQIVLLPNLLNVLRREAPGMRVDVSTITESTPAALESGEQDLAVGFMPFIDSRFYQQVLFEEDFVCLARSDHPRIRKSLTLKRYQDELHVAVKTSGTGHLVVEKTVEKLGIQRRLGVEIPNFIGLATVVGATDYLSTLPLRAGRILARTPGVRLLEPPFHIPSYQVKQHWHERKHRDPRLIWLRGVISKLHR